MNFIELLLVRITIEKWLAVALIRKTRKVIEVVVIFTFYFHGVTYSMDHQKLGERIIRDTDNVFPVLMMVDEVDRL